MLVNMKGGILGCGAILGILIIGSFVIIFMTQTGPLSAAVATKEGQMISFGNYVHLFVKNFNQSINFISQKAAYDLGKTGGIEGTESSIWSISYPKLSDLEIELEDKIKNLPTENIEGNKMITWREGSINVLNYDINPCGRLEDSNCFLVNGSKKFSVYDGSIKTKTEINHRIKSLISSSYFKLLYVGRLIVEDAKYSSKLNDPVGLENDLTNDFPGLDFTISLSGNILDVLIEDQICDLINEFYCIAPINPEEPGITINGDSVLYDYLKLNFKVNI